jgi:hypothetical protein
MSLDIQELLQENERLSAQPGSGFLDTFVKMPDGNGVVVMRLLPPAPKGAFGRDRNPFYQATRTHKLKGRSYQCIKQLEDKKWVGDCPVCRYYNWLWQESERQSPDLADATQNKAREIKPIERYYYNVMVRQQVNSSGEVETNVGPKILSVGKTLHKMIIRAIVGDKELNEAPLGDVTDLKTGRDFKLIKTMRQSGRESYPNYSDSKFLDVSPLGDPDKVKEWLSKLHDLTALRENSLLDYEALKHQLKVHLGLEEDEDSGFDPTEYQMSVNGADGAGDEDEPKVVVTSKAESRPAPAPKAESVPDAPPSKSLSEEDFMAQIQGIDIG